MAGVYLAILWLFHCGAYLEIKRDRDGPILPINYGIHMNILDPKFKSWNIYLLRVLFVIFWAFNAMVNSIQLSASPMGTDDI